MSRDAAIAVRKRSPAIAPANGKREVAGERGVAQGIPIRRVVGIAVRKRSPAITPANGRREAAGERGVAREIPIRRVVGIAVRKLFPAIILASGTQEAVAVKGARRETRLTSRPLENVVAFAGKPAKIIAPGAEKKKCVEWAGQSVRWTSTLRTIYLMNLI